jgi:hypothetical protein
VPQVLVLVTRPLDLPERFSRRMPLVLVFQLKVLVRQVYHLFLI